ncbi:hypothetical protein HYX02_03500 [Candidatus Woesearchaeota archaeon]|nr:hypothetical protein [Candidatus Woesearchaeota archaeon]
MSTNLEELKIVRIGHHISIGSLNEVQEIILRAFRGLIRKCNLTHYNIPPIDQIDALLLTQILNDEFGGQHVLGITDADLTLADAPEGYIFGGKNTQTNVAVVSTKRLCPQDFTLEESYNLYLSRIAKESLHEVGHNFGLTHHYTYQSSKDGRHCPMTKGDFKRFGEIGYVRAIIDGRGYMFCDICTKFLQRFHI